MNSCWLNECQRIQESTSYQGIYTKSFVIKAQARYKTDCHPGNPCDFKSHPTAKIRIEKKDPEDSLNAAAGGNLLSKTTREALKIIENKSKVRYSRSKSNVSRVNTNSRDSSSKTDDRIDKLADQISNLVEIVNKQVITPATAKAVEKTCVICGGAHPYYDCIATDSNQPSVCAATGTYNHVSSPNRARNQIPPPGFAPGFQNQPFQVPNNKIQPGIPNELSSYMKSNETLIRNMQNQINVLRGDFNKQEENLRRNLNNDLRNILGGFFQNQASTLGTLLSNTVPNPKGEMKAITTRSGLAYEGPSIPTNSPLKKVVERDTEETTDKEHSNCQGSIAHIQPPVVPISEPDVSKTQPKPNIPYPSRLNDQKLREKATNQMEKFFQIFHDLHFDISFANSLLLMPKFASTIKSLLTNKDKMFELAKVPLNENCSTMLLKKLHGKLGDPSKFVIPGDFPGIDINYSSQRSSEDVFVKVGKFHFPTDFVVIDFEADPRVPLILGRSFLRTGRALIDVYGEEITLKVNDESVTFNLNQTMRYSLTYDDNSVNRVDVIDIAYYKPAVQSQRRVNPKFHDVIKKEVIKLLDAGMIYPISDSPWVSPIHCVPKKGGMTVVANENNELIPTRPMTHLLEKETPFVFSKEYVDAFDTLKKKLTEAPILVVPDWNLPFELMCDASDFAIGAVMGQRKTKHFQPIHYASKTMNEAQIHYTTTEKEMLAVVYAFEKFWAYLVLSKSIVYTDHSALKYLLSKQDAKPRLLRWVLLLQEFDITIRDKKGYENLTADHLSRLKNPHKDVLENKDIDRVTHTSSTALRGAVGVMKEFFISLRDFSNRFMLRIDLGGSLLSHIRASPSNENGKSNSLIVVLGTSGCLNVDVALLKKCRWLCGSCLPARDYEDKETPEKIINDISSTTQEEYIKEIKSSVETNEENDVSMLTPTEAHEETTQIEEKDLHNTVSEEVIDLSNSSDVNQNEKDISFLSNDEVQENEKELTILEQDQGKDELTCSQDPAATYEVELQGKYEDEDAKQKLVETREILKEYNEVIQTSGETERKMEQQIESKK
nr:reverse transcriptase domain-containing protein [Tanacetum cinerariifolium]